MSRSLHHSSADNREVYGPERLAEIRASSDTLRAFFEEIYDQRVANLGADIISDLIRAEIDGEKLTRLEVVSMAILLLIGGVETTTNLLGNTLVELNCHPEVYARVRGNLALIPQVLEEVLRYNPPVQLIFRHTTADTEIAGVKIPKGSTIVPMLASANRDETKFPDPENFDIDRRMDFPFMSFAQGPHFCPGSYLTRMEAKAALEVVFQRLEVLEPVSNHIEWLDSYFARGPHKLPVRFKFR